MFDRLRHVFSRRSGVPTAEANPVAHWASSRFLSHRVTAPHQFELAGRLLERELRAECKASSRPYIEGLELRSRVDLALPPAGQVVLMSRRLLHHLQAQADALHDQAERDVQNRAEDMPDELRWLRRLREARWTVPDERFWSRYAVLSDAPDLARRWLDTEALEYLMAGDAEAAAQVPLLVALVRGKCYLRLQVNPHAQGADALLALELLEHLSARALQLAARAGTLDAESVSSPG